MTTRSRYVLGTAGHIDHGKTALVRALTGVDTDRLKEEKARGITIELGFAELERDGLPSFGVVDVPGHEAFVRAMLAGAAGMDVVVLVVAADEGVMPQTREHLGIVRLLGVPELVVAYTKADLVDREWLELVEADVEALLEETPYRTAPRVATSAVTGDGMEDLLAHIAAAAARVPARAADDLVRLPLDRVFTIQGTGTVVTGTLWSGVLRTGDKVRVLPQDLDGRVRSLQVHGREAEEARAGARTAVALTGGGADREVVARGATVVTSSAWAPSRMLTVRVQVLSDSAWSIEHNQRVHVHHGTAQVLARCVLLEDGVEALLPGDVGWVQLRLEEPLVVRGRDRLVLRSYSPVTTIAGGLVAESHPPKRNKVSGGDAALLRSVLDGSNDAAVEALLDVAGWSGVSLAELPVRTGATPAAVEEALRRVQDRGARVAVGHAFAPATWREARTRLESTARAEHARDPLRPVIPLALLRPALPKWAPSGLADAVLQEMVSDGALVAEQGGVRSPDHTPGLTAEQGPVAERIVALLEAGGLAPPFVSEYPPDLGTRKDLWSLLHWLAGEGRLVQVADDLYMPDTAVRQAGHNVRSALGGRTGLGPADFRDVLDITRKHLLPLLNYFDGVGVTVRLGEGRSVPSE